MGTLKFLISFGLGVYTGIYTSQNYPIGKVESPNELYERLIKTLDLQEKKE